MKTPELLQLFEQIDKERSVSAKLEIMKGWSENHPEVDSARIIYFDNHSLTAAVETAFSIPQQNAKLFPKEPAILNGRSPLPPGLFKDSTPCSVTMYYPFFYDTTAPAGALLLRAPNPKKLLSKYHDILGIMASKARDIVYTGQLKRHIRSFEPDSPRAGISPDSLGNLMNFLSIPMYITSSRGEFITVNRMFLEQFSYSSVEELNDEAEFFIESDDWNSALQKLISTAGFTGYTTKVKTGKGETKIVVDAATLIGKQTFGILYDITDYVRINEDLLDTLEEQKNINESLKNTAELLKKTQTTSMKSLAMLAEYRDMETGNHLHRICELNRRISEVIHKEQPYSFHISSDYVDDIYLSGMLHDIGKVGVPDSILLKNGSLSSQEWDVMRKHTVWGWDILHHADKELGEQSFLTLASRIALAHHERYDGSGYPRGLTGEEIPLSARISAISDVYDALTSKRPYKEAWGHEQAVEEILAEKGKHFDPVLIEVIESIESDLKRIKHDFPDTPVIPGVSKN